VGLLRPRDPAAAVAGGNRRPRRRHEEQEQRPRRCSHRGRATSHGRTHRRSARGLAAARCLPAKSSIAGPVPSLPASARQLRAHHTEAESEGRSELGRARARYM
jgi:hypothetical protein